jgi:hypothetical protein
LARLAGLFGTNSAKSAVAIFTAGVITRDDRGQSALPQEDGAASDASITITTRR